MNIIKTMLCGGVIGIANIIPGVSGGTMAVILNIYDKLIQSISELRTKPKQSITFLAPIGIGAVIAILLCSNALTYLLANQYMIINFFFIGIIIGSIPMLYKRASNSSKSKIIKLTKVPTSQNFIKISPEQLPPFLSTFILMILMMLFSDKIGIEETVITTLTPISFIKLFLGSTISAICMIIPGVSGSFIMLLFGVYTTIITAISTLNIILLIPVGLGVLTGILGGAKLIETVIKKHESNTYFAILGLVFGSIPILINNIIIENAFETNIKLIISIIVMLLSAKMTMMFDKSKN